MRVLIVDDEIIIREGLCQVVPWSEHGFQLLEPAVSAEEAMEVIRDTCPDIIITDIRMNGKSGLDLAAYVSGQRLPIEVILLTGYDEFSYAQEALRQGVSDYLLKASEPDAILHAVMRARDRLTDTKEHVQWKQWEHDRLILSLTKKIVADKFQQEDMDQLIELIPELQESALQVIMSDRSLPLTELKKKEELWNKYIFGKWLNINDRLTIIVRRDSRLEDEYLLQMAAKKITPSLEKPMLLGTVVSSISNLSASYQKAKSLLLYEWLLPDNKIISAKEILERDGIAHTENMKDYEDRLFHCMNTGGYQELTRLLEELVTWLFSHPHATPGSIQLYVQTLFISMLRFVNRVASSVGKRTINYKSLHPPGEWFPFYQDRLIPSFLNVMDDYRDLVDRQSNYVQMAILYIENRLNKQLSLQEVANHVHVNPSYLSEMLRKETGTSYVELITQLRMKKAEELLIHTPAKVKEVSNQVGYADWKYFTSQFKKHTGETPTQYRRRLKTDVN
ncbi:response regulator transcription factor [Gracilibacillus sp. D59]|uniref:response regulator transcription factor n=1 Tax=Gracilibacillus sp. D59 TaxID=3457434 RepID=UPI003FCE1C6A